MQNIVKKFNKKNGMRHSPGGDADNYALVIDVGVKLFCSHCQSADISEETLTNAQESHHRRITGQSQDH